MFSQSNLPLSVAQPMQYDEDTYFNDKNATQYLAEIEEYIGLLITILAYKQELPNAAIAAIPLEKLSVKEFAKSKMQVDMSEEGKFGFSKDEGDQEGDKEDLATTGKDLYMKFQEKRQKMGYSSIQNDSNA